MNWVRKMFVCIVVLGALTPQVLRGQAVTGTVAGSVTDPSGSVVPGAQVVLRSTETGVETTVSTNTVGNYSAPFLRPGNYTLVANHVGFQRFVQENITVRVASTVEVNVQLQVGSATQTIDVTAAPPLLQTESGAVASTLDQRQLAELPSLDRNYQDIISILPGTSQPSQSITDIGPDDTHLTAVNGLERYSNNYMIDGVDNNDVILGNTFQVPPIGSIQEVNVQTTDYDAEFGRAGGAVVNVQTRSGTNQFHGSAFGFHRDTFLRAQRALPREISLPPYVRNQYGGTLGGPIIKNRIFFFGDFQAVNLRQSTTQLLSVPIPAFRQGDFSSVLGEPLGILDPAGNEIYSGSIFDPSTGDANGNGRLVFPRNIIPPDRFDSPAKQMTDLIPLPNIPDSYTDNLSVRVPSPLNTYNFDARIDYTLSATTNLFVKYNFKNTNNESFSYVGPALRPDGFLTGKGHLRAQNVTGNVTHSFGADTVAEFRFGLNKFDYKYAGFNQRTADEFGIQGFDPGTPLPLMYFYDGSVTNIGFYPYYPLVNDQTTAQWSTSWTKVEGSHRLKWGADVRLLHLKRASRGSDTGTFFFYDFVTRGADDAYVDLLDSNPGRTFSSFLLGLPAQLKRNQLLHPPEDRAKQFFFFAQDAWQVTPKLNLTLGLRWELYPPVTAPDPGGAANYDPATGRVLVAGLGDISAGGNVRYDFRNFAPRFGFAYKLGSKTVLRGGYGVSYMVHPMGGAGALLSTNFPNVSVQIKGDLSGYFPAGTLDQTLPLSSPELPPNGIYDPAPPLQQFYSLAFDTKFSYVQSYDLTVERELLPDLTLDVGYVGNRGVDLWSGYNEMNYSPPGSGDDGGALYKKFGFESSATQVRFDASSVYNSLQIKLNKRLSHGISLTNSYTWQRGIGYINGPLFPEEFRKLGRGADTNKQQFVASHLWELPFGPNGSYLKTGFLSHILGGWQYNGILSLYGGPPFSVYADPGRLNGVRLKRNQPDVLGTAGILGHTGPGELFFDTSVFRPPPSGVYGNAGAQLLYGPGLINYDASVFRKFPFGEGRYVELRMESFNITNTPHWDLPQNNIDRDRFGEILSAADDARRVQFAVRLVF